MCSSPARFQEASFRTTPLRDLQLAIEGTRLAPIIKQFQNELAAAGIQRVRPHFYLSTEWGVPFNTVAIGIPFYLAHPQLVAVHAERVGHIEGFNRNDILRYLRHEMGHVVNYAYRLYEEERWVQLFGAMTQPYLEHYRPEPFSTRYVQHLPGWYAQKHPDEDWAETFAVWMTPGEAWRHDYAHWPQARSKLEYCDAKMAALREQDPLVTAIDRDDDVQNLACSVDEYYHDTGSVAAEMPAGMEGALRSIFDQLDETDQLHEGEARIPASTLIRRLERTLMADVYCWTGHFPEDVRALVRHLARQADELSQFYPPDRELEAAAALAALVTSLAMNYVHRGTYWA